MVNRLLSFNTLLLPLILLSLLQDDEAELLAELERIKRERAEEAARKASSAVLGVVGTWRLVVVVCMACMPRAAGGGLVHPCQVDSVPRCPCLPQRQRSRPPFCSLLPHARMP